MPQFKVFYDDQSQGNIYDIPLNLIDWRSLNVVVEIYLNFRHRRIWEKHYFGLGYLFKMTTSYISLLSLSKKIPSYMFKHIQVFGTNFFFNVLPMK